MNIRDIEAFVAVAEAGSINRAALRLNLTQPATTRRVQNFEAAIGGVTLLDRRVKPPVLTPAGRQVLERCRAALKAISELKASVSSGVPAGELRIGVAYGLGEVILSSPFDDLQRRFPEVHLRISSNWTVRLIDEVRTGALDCAIGLVVEGHQLPAGVRAVALGDEDIAVVTVRESGRRKLPGRVRLSDLAGRAWVLNPRGCICRGALERAMDRAGLPMQVGAEVFGAFLPRAQRRTRPRAAPAAGEQPASPSAQGAGRRRFPFPRGDQRAARAVLGQARCGRCLLAGSRLRATRIL